MRTSDEEEENENPRPNESGAPEVALGKIIEVSMVFFKYVVLDSLST